MKRISDARNSLSINNNLGTTLSLVRYDMFTYHNYRLYDRSKKYYGYLKWAKMTSLCGSLRAMTPVTTGGSRPHQVQARYHQTVFTMSVGTQEFQFFIGELAPS